MALSTLNHGINVQQELNTAKWFDNSSHLFRSVEPLPLGTTSIKFTKTGHGRFGVCDVTEYGELNVISDRKVQCKKEHGEGIITNDGNTVTLKKNVPIPMDDIGGKQLYLFVDIRFGDLTFQTSGDILMEACNENGLYINGEMKLKNQYPQSHYVLEEPLRIGETLDIEIGGADPARHWNTEIYLSNTPLINDVPVCIGSDLKNKKGFLQMTLMSDGDTCMKYSLHNIEKTVNMEHLHLSQKIYMIFKLYRSQVAVKRNLNQTEVPIGYVNIAPGGRQIVPTDSCLQQPSSMVHRRPENNFEPQPLKTPRLSFSFPDNQQTSPKCIEDNSDSAVENLIRLLRLSLQMKSLDMYKCLPDTFLTMRREFQTKLLHLKNNYLIQIDQKNEIEEMLRDL